MKELFSNNPDINKNAYLNWRTRHHQPIHNMMVLAEGYFDSSKLLTKCCLEDNTDKKADAVIFPILFSFNHGIELYLKSICWSLNLLLNYKSKYPKNHNIRGIWYSTKDKIQEFGFDIDRPKQTFFNMVVILERYIEEISNTIKREGSDINSAHHNIDFSRYPINNKEEYHFYLQTFDNVVVDLENLLKLIEDINNCLHLLSNYYYDLVLGKWDKGT